MRITLPLHVVAACGAAAAVGLVLALGALRTRG